MGWRRRKDARRLQQSLGWLCRGQGTWMMPARKEAPKETFLGTPGNLVSPTPAPSGF